VSLIKKEQFTEAYSAIQPNLVIPALVHNGELYTESIDIIEYLDSVLAGERLVPSADDPRYEDFHYLTELGKKLHWSIRHVTYRWGGVGRLNAKEQDKVESLLKRGQDEENLAEFYRDFNQGKISQETYDEHLRAIGQGFDELTKRLKDGRLFLTGDSLTIADAIWAMKVIRLEEMAYPTRELHLEVSEWFARIAARPSYETLVGNYRVLRLVFKVKSWLEKKLGTGLYWAAKRVVS
ncbi:MAG: glutathione S-transferase family protein, partial [Cellvibrionaceae bacterium]|nr:glutathione S-transferase family protein [Cellvibrionaceae bacterium]